MTNPQEKFTFIHIPKTAGTSLEYNLGMLPHSYDVHEEKNTSKPPASNIFYPTTGENLGKTIHANPDFTLLTFVRNPWERFVSLYRHSMRVRKDAREKKVFKPKQRQPLSFGEYVEMIIRGRAEGKGEALDYFNNFDWFHTRFSQTEYITNYDSSNILRARDPYFHRESQKWVAPVEPPKGYLQSGLDLSSRKVNFVGRFENLQNDYIRLTDFLKVDLPPLPYHTHHSDGPAPYKEFFNPESERLIGNFYQEDVEYFNYCF